MANDSLAGANVNESTLALGGQMAGFFEARGDTGDCQDDSEDGDVCASTGITLARSGQLLLNASGEWSTFSLDDANGPSAGTDDTGRVVGVCALRVDGTVIGPMDGNSIGERSEGGTVANHPFEAPGTVALTALSDVLPAGSHTADVPARRWTATSTGPTSA